MRFYEGHTLIDSDNELSFFNKKHLTFSNEFRQSCIKKFPRHKEFLEKMELKIVIRPYANEQKTYIYLKGSTPESSITLAQVTLSTIEYNCSALGVANLYVDYFYSLGFGWFLLDLVEDWAKYAGYTLLIGNTAGYDQNLLIPKFKEKGWIESNINYVNSRTRNRNIWLYKVIADVEEGNDDEDDDEYYEEDNSDEDEEF